MRVLPMTLLATSVSGYVKHIGSVRQPFSTPLACQNPSFRGEGNEACPHCRTGSVWQSTLAAHLARSLAFLLSSWTMSSGSQALSRRLAVRSATKVC
jgi:hypothetical protein